MKQLEISLTLSSPYANNPMPPCQGYNSQSAWGQPIFPLFSYPYEIPWWFRGKESTVKSPAIQEIPSIPGSGRSPGEWNGYPLRIPSILIWRVPWTGSLADCSPRGGRESDTTERLSTHIQEWESKSILQTGEPCRHVDRSYWAFELHWLTISRPGVKEPMSVKHSSVL